MPDHSRPGARPRPVASRPSVERCEPRLLLSTFEVTSTADDGAGSLREAIRRANADPAADLIRFAIDAPGVQVIRPASALPTIADSVTIDATTQPGYSGSPLVILDGVGTPGGTDGIRIQADRSTVQGLAVVDFPANGIAILGATGCVVRANVVGFDPRTLVASPNQADGILLSFAPGNVIGQPGAGNLIGGNGGSGIRLTTLSSGNLIQGNVVGTSPDARGGVGLGVVNLRNAGDGISQDSSSSTTIGGTAAGAGNVLSSNGGYGVDVVGGSGNLLQGNLIGLGPDGDAARGNGAGGVFLGNSSGNTVGGTLSAAGNVISANGGRGLNISQPSASGNLVQGNNFGLNAARDTPVGNVASGVVIEGAPGNTIGGTTPGSGNFLSANGGNGVLITSRDVNGTPIPDPRATGNLVQGNIIGTNDASTTDPKFGNAFDGVAITDAPSNTVGGSVAGAGNIIVLNQGNGVHLTGGGARDIVVQGNHIGTDLLGTTFLGNFHVGVNLQSSPNNLIGGTTPGARNYIVSSQVDAIDIQTTDADPDGNPLPADNNLVQGNYIGISLDPDGAQVVLQNVNNGLFVVASGNTIGGSAPGAGNLISQNNSIGITVGSLNSPVGLITARGNVIQGNIIGLDATGTRQAGNGRDGIQLIGAIDTLVGGTAQGAGNVISGNTIGMEIFSPISGPNVPLNAVIQGNIIGLGSDGFQVDPLAVGDSSLRNTSDGIILGAGAQGVTIGGTGPGARNVISGNGSSGIRFASASSNNLVEGNYIGVARDGLTPRGNNQSGIFIAEASSNETIGGTAAGAGNVISGNSSGVTIANAGTVNNLFLGNLVGLAVDGSTVVGNGAYGFLLLAGTAGNTIGGSAPGARNVISGNGQGIDVSGPNVFGTLIRGNYVGTDATGTSPRGNERLGIVLSNSDRNTIGGTAPGEGNLISGNAGVGVLLTGGLTTGNLIVGNRIGTDWAGARVFEASGSSLGNASYGIQVDEAPFNTIGGDTPGARNVVSGNRLAGVEANGLGSVGTAIRGNYIGTDAAGSARLGNFADGILIDNAPGVVVGGVTGHEANIVSGNLGNGIQVAGAGAFFDAIVGNLIGTDASGGVGLGNALSGVFVNGAPGVTIGGTIATLRNVISGNEANGVRVAGAGSAGSVVLGNLIGTDASGRAALGNLNDGVLLDGALAVAVGGPVAGSTNVISGNGSAGVEFGGVATYLDVVQGNLIGTDLGGTLALGNSIGVFVNNSPFNLVGGTSPFSGNLISGNAGVGVFLFGVGATGNAVQGNRVGTDLSGLAALGNQAGVFVNEAGGNLIGGPLAGAGNLLSGNTAGGVVLQGTGAIRDVVQGNVIGLDATGSRAISSPRQQAGVLIVDAPGNVIGGSDLAARNVISGNLVGVVISGFNGQGNLVLGNSIGTDGTGRFAVGNTTGVYLNGSSSNTVGGTTPGSGNVISGNSATGVSLFGPQTTLNRILGNRIGTDLSGSVAVPNMEGIYVESSPANTIGGPTAAAGNTISGNTVAGVYLFSGAAGNLIQGNKIGLTAGGSALGNLQYGILLFNASNNVVDKSPATGNRIANSGIGNFREFTGSVSSSTSTTSTRAKAKAVTGAAHPAGPRATARG